MIKGNNALLDRIERELENELVLKEIENREGFIENIGTNGEVYYGIRFDYFIIEDEEQIELEIAFTVKKSDFDKNTDEYDYEKIIMGERIIKIEVK